MAIKEKVGIVVNNVGIVAVVTFAFVICALTLVIPVDKFNVPELMFVAV